MFFSFPGMMYAPPEDDFEMIVIYDVKGYIAGMHSVVPKDVTNEDKYFPFSSSKWYRSTSALGKDIYVATAYFLDVNVICTGRTSDDFATQGTGNKLLLQNGPMTSDVITAPLKEEDATTDGFWFKNWCFVQMGHHYFNLNYNVSASCDEFTPIGLIYHDGDLDAFAWHHHAPIAGDRWETPDATGLGMIYDRPPQCGLDLSATPGGKTMHVYLRGWIETCIFE
jgi:hypothetical protein